MIWLLKCDKLVHNNNFPKKLYFSVDELDFLKISMMKLELYSESRKWVKKKKATKILHGNLPLVVLCSQTDCES